MAYKIKNSGIAWYLPKKKKPIGYTTKAEQVYFDYLYYEVYNQNLDLVLEHLQNKDLCIVANNKALINVLKVIQENDCKRTCKV